jgi:hypothetical protein
VGRTTEKRKLHFAVTRKIGKVTYFHTILPAIEREFLSVERRNAMNLTKKLVVLMVAVFVTFLGSSVAAKNPFQVTYDEVFIDPPVYISCLDEPVSAHVLITIRYREFETPSGNYHRISYWTWDSVWTGEWTGRVWHGKGQSPDSMLVRDWDVLRGVMQWTSRELARPVPVEDIEDGPKFRYNQRFKITYNENGDLKVLYEPPVSIADWIRCLGPNH